MENLFDPALARDDFQLFYQPIVSLKGDSQENYSVFLRVREDAAQPRRARDLLAAAARSAQRVAIDRWVIDQAVEELAWQYRQNRRINFFVNIAEETLEESRLLIWICDQLRRCKARGNWLTVQILEDHVWRHSAAFADLREGLARVKCRVALNRYGLGTNPEVLLRTQRADFIKLAPELSAGVAEDERKLKRLAQLAAAVRKAGMRTVVTSVEDPRTLTALWTAGIDYIQGNFLHEAAPSIELPGETD